MRSATLIGITKTAKVKMDKLNNLKGDRVVKLQPKVTHRCCPECGYIISQIEVYLIRAAVKCPRGCDRNINEFQPMNMI